MRTTRYIIGFAVFILINRNYVNAQQTVTDIDGNVYQTIRIGNQVWMKENLKTTHYSDSTAIPLVNNVTSWDALTTTSKAYCWYNDDIANKATYGALYTWTAAMNGSASTSANPSNVKGACPTGWHIPSNDEWTQLTTFLGGESAAGGKLKETDTTYWGTPNTGATNEVGFTALPDGGRFDDGTFASIENYGNWWSATEGSTSNAWSRFMFHNLSNVERSNDYKALGFSVRCIEDPIPDSARYFGQTPPGDTAVLFAPGIVSKANRWETSITFSPDGKECYFDAWDSTGGGIYYMKYENNAWTEQEELPLSVKLDHKATTPFFSASGNRLYFDYSTSDNVIDIQFVERTSGGWGDPQILPLPFNTGSTDYSYSETADGIAYITSNRPGSIGNSLDIWRIKPLTDSTYQSENLGATVNSSTEDFISGISPDGSYLIFASYRSSAYSEQSLWISFNKGNGWTAPIDMENSKAKINIPRYWQISPSLSPDGKYLFFTHHANNRDSIHIFWVSTHIIGGLKKAAFAPKKIRQIPNMNITTDSTINYVIPENIFSCEYGTASLKYTATLKNGSALPYWLHFDPETRTLSGRPTQTETDTLKITATNTDSMSATCIFRINVASKSSINQLEVDKIKIFPNPNHGQFNLSFGKSPAQKILVEIQNIDGKVVLLKTFQNVATAIIDLSEHPTGIYLVKVDSGNESYFEKIIKN